MNNFCGTCIGGSQMLLGCYQKCWSCNGTGKCNHVWGKPKFKGKQWNETGTKQIPDTRVYPCKKCAAQKIEKLTQSRKIGSCSIYRPSVGH